MVEELAVCEWYMCDVRHFHCAAWSEVGFDNVCKSLGCIDVHHQRVASADDISLWIDRLDRTHCGMGASNEAAVAVEGGRGWSGEVAEWLLVVKATEQVMVVRANEYCGREECGTVISSSSRQQGRYGRDPHSNSNGALYLKHRRMHQ